MILFSLAQISDEEEVEARNSTTSRRNHYKPGFSFWIVIDWPKRSVPAFERKITKVCLESGLDVQSCTEVKSRGKHFKFKVFLIKNVYFLQNCKILESKS